MKTLKIKTKGGHCAVIINDKITVVYKEDQYFIYDNAAGDYSNGKTEQIGIEPFIEAYLANIEKKKTEATEKIEAARIAEEQLISKIKTDISLCETPNELACMFGFDMVETAGHWSDLYEGRSGYACKISSRADYEIMQMAIEQLGIEGEWVELRNRAGEHHCTSSSVYSLDDYQKNCLNYFSDKFFYKSQDTEKEWYSDQIKEAAGDGDLEKVRSLLDSYDELENEAGYYDCNGNLEILESDVESDDFTGYSYDVYSYSFAFAFEHKYSFSEIEEMEAGNEE